MVLGKIALSCAAAFLLLSTVAAADAQTSPDLSHAEQLDVMGDFFVVRTEMLAVMRESCDTDFRTHLDTDSAFATVEKALPGITDKMVGVASSYCDAEMSKALDTGQSTVRSYWDKALSPADLSRVAALLLPIAQRVRSLKIPVQRGDTTAQIVDRISAPQAEREKLFKAALAALLRSPGGPALARKVTDYLAIVQPTIDQAFGAMHAVTIEAFKRAHHEANLMARAHHMSDLYAED